MSNLIESNITTQEKSTNKHLSIYSLISGIPSYIGILLSLVVTLSVIHDYVYFSIVGSNFLSLMSPTDYLKNSIYWVPSAFIFSFLGLWWVYSDAKHRYKLMQTDHTKAAAAYRWPDRIMYISQGIVLISALVSLPYMTFEKISITQIPFSVVTVYLTSKFIMQPIIHKFENPLNFLVLSIIFQVMIINAIYGGIREGVLDLKKSEPLFTLTANSANKEVLILRIVEKGIIYRSKNGDKLEFTPWDEIKNVQSPVVKLNDEQFYVRFINYFRNIVNN